MPCKGKERRLVIAGAQELGLRLVGEIIESPLRGAAQGNTEFLALFEVFP